MCVWSSVIHTCGKSLLAEGQSVPAALELHVYSRQRGAFVHELHGQSGGVRWTTGQFKLGSQRPGTFGGVGWGGGAKIQILQRLILLSAPMQNNNNNNNNQ